jgi:hypothetical protein
VASIEASLLAGKSNSHAS